MKKIVKLIGREFTLDIVTIKKQQFLKIDDIILNSAKNLELTYNYISRKCNYIDPKLIESVFYLMRLRESNGYTVNFEKDFNLILCEIMSPINNIFH